MATSYTYQNAIVYAPKPTGDSTSVAGRKTRDEFTYLYPKLAASFDPTAGHSHDGTTDDAGPQLDGAEAIKVGTITQDRFAANVGVSGLQGLFKNLKIINGATANSQVAVTADAVVLYNASSQSQIATSVSLTLTTGTTGANALDAGTVANSTWYSVWVIAKDDGTTAGLLSTSATTPTLPTGYTYKARVGWVITDASANLKRTLQYGRVARYVSGTNMIVMDSTAKGNVTTPTWVAIAIGAFVPSTACFIAGSLRGGGGAILAPNNTYGGNASATPPPVATQGGSIEVSTPFNLMLESSNIYWASTSADDMVSCYGWEDNL